MAKQTDKITKEWKSKGWWVLNLTTTNKHGICDYLMKKKGETDVFVESKESWDRLSELQKFRINEILDLGCRVMVNDTEILEHYKLKNELF